jgi:ADP-ribose pyrophosphatase YjhB (NUDIX family)
VDIIIELDAGHGRKRIVLVERKNPPPGWALPGGFVDYGESLEEAAVREAAEETSLRVKLRYQLHTYSDPGRDTRKHTISTVYVARARGSPKPQDDARALLVVDPRKIDRPLAFDHERIIKDYLAAERKRGR